jgi:hypothetical protein
MIEMPSIQRAFCRSAQAELLRKGGIHLHQRPARLRRLRDNRGHCAKEGRCAFKEPRHFLTVFRPIRPDRAVAFHVNPVVIQRRLQQLRRLFVYLDAGHLLQRVVGEML